LQPDDLDHVCRSLGVHLLASAVAEHGLSSFRHLALGRPGKVNHPMITTAFYLPEITVNVRHRSDFVRKITLIELTRA
jgi:hypothetical protein